MQLFLSLVNLVNKLPEDVFVECDVQLVDVSQNLAVSLFFELEKDLLKFEFIVHASHALDALVVPLGVIILQIPRHMRHSRQSN